MREFLMLLKLKLLNGDQKIILLNGIHLTRSRGYRDKVLSRLE
jgi:hypothetical protein